ncbi:SDR family NAD(P)-dependent oxidoreductase, partial [Rhodoblastus sp.]|uniref:SDR family NAD(P)-dependent oxidoreductase n=1 Tax=Rhodoblastus sp. TaxID=1962975 RepID=UPI003F98D06D
MKLYFITWIEINAMQIQDKVFVVSGGGSGLGAAVARQIVAAGGKVVIADINAEAGQKIAAELGAFA